MRFWRGRFRVEIPHWDPDDAGKIVRSGFACGAIGVALTIWALPHVRMSVHQDWPMFIPVGLLCAIVGCCFELKWEIPHDGKEAPEMYFGLNTQKRFGKK